MGKYNFIFLMRPILKSEDVKIPEDVTVEIKNKLVLLKGPRGTIARNFRHVPCDITYRESQKVISVEIWFQKKKILASCRTVVTHIENMIQGVTEGFLYKMRLVYAHFPITFSIEENGNVVEIKNFLGEKLNRRIDMCDGVKCVRSKDVKDEIYIVGNNKENVGLSAANIKNSCNVKKKDIRKFLDGIYVSERS